MSFTVRSNIAPDEKILEQAVNLKYLGHDGRYKNDGRPTYITYITYVTYITDSILVKCEKRVSIEKFNKCRISGFRREVDEICPLLGYYASSRSNILPTFRDNRSVSP